MTLFRGSDSAGQGSSVEFLRSDRDLSDVDSPSNSRTNLGLGSLATQSSSSIAVTGGTITGLTSLGANTLDTGQGANELYPMDQAVQTTDAVTFATVNTGQGANELYAMDQPVQTTDDVTFNTVDTSEVVNCQNTSTAWVNYDQNALSIRDSYNVDSVTDEGQGDHTINFTTALSDSNYCVVSSSQETGDARGAAVSGLEVENGGGAGTPPATGSVRIRAWSLSDGTNTPTPTDMDYNLTAILGGD